jgi:uncharacterized Zn finger protein (UPF0148 family)
MEEILMKCRKCGTEFFEGLFCPECGTKWISENDNMENEQAQIKAEDILKQYEAVDEEKKQIKEIGWNQDRDCLDRAKKRLEQLRRLEQLNLKSEYARCEIIRRERDLRNDYYQIQNENYSMKSAVGYAVGLSLATIFLIAFLGIIGIIIGIVLIIGAIGILMGPQESKKTMKEIDDFLANSNK